ncbi:hypothetical protein AbraIFM66950_000167 [Aspergillus brasiliensis]|nr:hypothetical protein AbraIFM66950_000167 [Aspergillus brasiliensis]
MDIFRQSGKLQENKVPDYEIRLGLEPAEVLTPSIELKADVLSTLNLQPIPVQINVGFLDTPTKELSRADWSVRARRVHGEDTLELTYKRRYGINNGNIDYALTYASTHGFNNELTGDGREFKAQVEWGYEKQTLSMTSKKKLDGFVADDLEFPPPDNLRNLASTEAPDKFINWIINGWGTHALERSIVYGPTVVDRYSGLWEGKQLDLEVWPFVNSSNSKTDYMVEVSFKTNNRASASYKQRKLIDELKSKGWLVDEDVSKTEAILEVYGF